MCAKFVDLTGVIFGRLTVVGLDRINDKKSAVWICRCECGNEKSILAGSLTYGDSRSCGCLRKETAAKMMTIHGAARRQKRLSEYKTWSGMITRCTNPNSDSYANYGGRGIGVCDEWRSFENFLRDMGSRPSRNHSLDRIKNELGYSKGNCRWATKTEQARNRRDNRIIDTPSGPMVLCEAAEQFGLTADLIRSRLNSGFPIEKVFSKMDLRK
jgi:hypothetical protein